MREKLIVKRTYEVLISKEDLDYVKVKGYGVGDLAVSATRCADGGDLSGTLCKLASSSSIENGSWIHSRFVVPGDIVLYHVYYEVKATDVQVD